MAILITGGAGFIGVGWQPHYTDYEKVAADFISEVKARPEFYGLV